MKHLLIAFLAGLSLVNCGENGSLKDEKSSPADNKDDRNQDCLKLALNCSESLPCDGKGIDVDAETSCNPMPIKHETCDWIVAESDPPQIFGSCESDAGESIVISLRAYFSTDKKYSVKTNDGAKSELQWKVNAYDLTVDLAAAKGTNVKFSISYTGDGTIPEKIDDQLPKDKAECDHAGKEFKKIMATIEAEPKTCNTDADCISYGPSPAAICGKPEFTSKLSFAKYQPKFNEIISNVRQHCELVDTACAATLPVAMVCTKQKICAGEI